MKRGVGEGQGPHLHEQDLGRTIGASLHVKFFSAPCKLLRAATESSRHKGGSPRQPPPKPNRRNIAPVPRYRPAAPEQTARRQ